MAERLVGATGRSRETARLVRYLGALVAVMFVIVAYLIALALIQGNARWVEIALPFVGEAVVIFASRALLDRGRVTGATVTFVWGSVAAIIPFVALFPVAYPASVLAVAQIEAIGLAYLSGRALIVTLIGMTVAAGLVTALGTTLGSSGGVVERATITGIVLLSFGLLSLILALNQARLTRAVREAEAGRAEAERAVRARDDFLAVASHELRTPLTALELQLQGMEAMLSRSADGDPAVRRVASRALTQGRRLGGLVEELLDVSRVTAGRLHLDLETFDLREAVRAAGDELAEQAERAQCPISVVMPDDVVGTWDRARLQRVVSNLLSNAIKYAPGGPILVVLERLPRAARLRVRDSGHGVPAEQMPHLFERFARLSPLREFGGLGLGLYIARRIVEEHGGSIRAESTAGNGATFTVEVPLETVAPRDQSAAGDAVTNA